MEIIPIDTDNRRHVKLWLDLPFRLYADVPQWVPPLAGDAKAVLDRHHYAYFEHSDAAFFMAMEGDRAIGRVVALDNAHFNELRQENAAFFYLFECENNPAASQGLFEAAFAWAKARGRTKIMGPKGFTSLDGLGLLVKGFEHRPALGIPYNPPYYADLVEAAGFTRLDDDVSGYLNAHAMNFPPKIHEVAEMVMRRRGLRIARFKTKNDLRKMIPGLKALYNGSLGMNWDQVPLTDAEMDTLANQILSIADPGLIKIVMKDDEPVGFLLAYPDISAALQRTKGRLFPFGFIDILLETKRTRWLNVNGAGILPKYQGLGGTAILFSELYKSVVEWHCDHAEVVQVSMTNEKMQREMRDLGIEFYKVHRVYTREL